MQEISVIVPTKNCALPLERLLKSLENQEARCKQIIVVDGGSVDDTLLVAQRYGVILERGEHMAAAKNAGFRLASASAVLFLDSDMEVGPSLIRSCQSTIEACDAACIREVVKSDNIWGRARGWEKACYFQTGVFEAARLFRREAFSRLGGYDERFVNSVEDIELQSRLIGSGYRLGWVTDPIIHHEEGLRFLNYISKRRGRGFFEFEKINPKYWHEFTSPLLRARLQWKWFLDNPSALVGIYIAALNLLRLTEWVARTTA
jgi:glycosyltransferase involved in cell wall biosynthesis